MYVVQLESDVVLELTVWPNESIGFEIRPEIPQSWRALPRFSVDDYDILSIYVQALFFVIAVLSRHELASAKLRKAPLQLHESVQNTFCRAGANPL